MAYFSIRPPVLNPSKKFLVCPALLLAGAALLAGCHPAAVAVKDPNDPKFIVAEKGAWQITESELETEVTSYLKQHQATSEQVGPAKMPIVKTAMLRNIVLKKLILDQAAALPAQDTSKEEAAELDRIKGPMAEPEFEKELQSSGLTLDDLKKRIHEKILVSKVLETKVLKNLDPTEQQIDDIYLKNKASFNIPDKIRASRVLIHVEDKASAADKAAKKKAIDAARARVVHGEDFGKVAADVSDDQDSKAKGGDLGYFQRNENEPGFDDVAFATKVNTISPVFLTPLGYQFLKVTDVHSAGVVPVADARRYIASKLREMNMEEQSQAYAKKLLAESGITYHMVMVDPPAEDAAPGPGGPNGAPPSSVPDSSATTPPAEAPIAPATNAPAQ